ncbi:MAG: hypothetical protein ABJQ34_16090 [Paracoccaceae bacterium]
MAIFLAPFANAATFLGTTFDDNAFADVLLSDASGHTVWNAPSAEAALTGADANTTAFNTTIGSFVTLGFTDNKIVNGTGADLAIFELFVEAAEDIYVTIGGVQVVESQTFTGFTNASGFDVYVSLFDLSDFGVAAGGTITSVTLQGDCTTAACAGPGLASSPFVAVGAINSLPVAPVPLPASLPFLFFGVAAFG